MMMLQFTEDMTLDMKVCGGRGLWQRVRQPIVFLVLISSISMYSRILLVLDFQYYLLFISFRLSYYLVVIDASFPQLLTVISYRFSFNYCCAYTFVSRGFFGNNPLSIQDKGKTAYTPFSIDLYVELHFICYCCYTFQSQISRIFIFTTIF